MHPARVKSILVATTVMFMRDCVWCRSTALLSTLEADVTFCSFIGQTTAWLGSYTESWTVDWRDNVITIYLLSSGEGVGVKPHLRPDHARGPEQCGSYRS